MTRKLFFGALALAAISAPGSAWALSPGCDEINTFSGTYIVDGAGNGTDIYTTTALADGEAITYSWSGNTKGAYVYLIYTQSGPDGPGAVHDSTEPSGAGSFTLSNIVADDYLQMGLEDTGGFSDRPIPNEDSWGSSVAINISCAAASPLLDVAMTHDGDAVPGGALAYTITPSTTLLPTTSAPVTADFTLPTGMTYVDASGAGWACDGVGQAGSCTRTASFGTGDGQAITLNTLFAGDATSPLVPSVTLSGGGASNTPSATSSTVVQQAPASVTIAAGGGQSASVNSAFATALRVTITDGDGAVVPGATVTFTAPASGASGVFTTGGTNTQTVTADASGVATASVFTANATAGGPYAVTATSGAVSTSVNLTNSLPPATVTALAPASGLLGGGAQVTITGTGFTGGAATGAVKFGPTDAIYTIDSNTQITATSPPGSQGAVHVTVKVGSVASATSAADLFTYTTVPSVSMVTPSIGPLEGGMVVTITGSNFATLADTGAVKFGLNDAVYTVIDDTQIIATSPPGSAGVIDVVVTTADGSSPSVGGSRFKYFGGPTVVSVTPSSGPPSGGTFVTVVGTGFLKAAATGAVKFGSTDASYTIIDDTHITATSPAGTGFVNVLITTAGEVNTAGGGSQFHFFAGAFVTSVTPSNGPIAGGTTSVIRGSGFSAVAATGAVKFGPNIATYTIDSDTQITATSPAGAAGIINVIVTKNGADSATSAGSQFNYLGAPVVTGISPISGSPSGNTEVSISGFNFTGVLPTGAVKFGALDAASYTVIDSSHITARSPAASVGTVDITVTGNGVTSAAVPAGQFTYGTAISITGALSPAVGLTVAPASVTITGTNFSATGNKVSFGGVSVTPSSESTTSITVTPPDHAQGRVDVTVTTADGRSLTKSNGYAYYPPFAISAAFGAGPILITGSSSLTITVTSGANPGAYTGFAIAPSSLNGLSVTATPTNTCGGTATIGTDFSYSGGRLDITCKIVLTVASSTPGTFSFTPGAPSVTGPLSVTGVVGSQTSLTVNLPVPVLVSFTAPAVVYDAAAGTIDAASGAAPTNGPTDWLLFDSSTNAYAASGASTGQGTASIDSAGVLTYTPRTGYRGDDIVYVKASNSGGESAPAAITIPVGNPTFSVSLPSATGTAGTAYNVGGTSVTMSGGAAAYSAFSATGLPDGLTMDSAGVISGAPTSATSATVVVTATDSSTPPFTSTASAALTIGVAAPTVTSLSPISGPATGGTTVTLTGTGFSGATAVDFGATGATSFTVNNSTGITATAPAGTGTVDVRVTTAGGTSATSALDQFTYVPSPMVTSISPASGSTLGGTPVTITGASFTGGTGVSIGGVPATGITFVNDTTITATTPAGTAGTASVLVTTPAGTNADNAIFTYVTPGPTVSAISPASGTTLGGTAVTITGVTFIGATAVTIGGISATGITVVDDTTITATTPAHTAGTASVLVTTPAGTNADNALFTYVTPSPTVTSLSPTSGPATGGTTVTLTGTNFTGATGLTIGGTSATDVTVVDATTITATTPAGTAGTANVLVTTPAGTNADNALFTYVAVANAITFTAPADTPLDGSQVDLIATATSGLTVTFASETIAVCTVSGAMATLVGVGTCSITASEPGDAAYAAATPVTHSFAVLTPHDTAQTVALIDDFSSTRADLLLAHGPDIDRQIDRLRGTALPSPDAISQVMGLMSSLSGPEPELSITLGAIRQATGDTAPSPLDIWIDGTFGLFDKASATGKFGMVNFGADYVLNPVLLIGFGAELDLVEQTQKLNPGSISGTGWLAGPYLTANLGSDLYLSLRVAAGRSANEISPAGTYTDAFGATRWLLDAQLSGSWQADGWTFAPVLQLSYFEERSDAYTDTLGLAIPSVTTGLAQLSLTPALSYTFALDDSGTVINTGVSVGGGASLRNDNGNFSWDGLFDEIGATTSISVEGGASLALSVNANALLTSRTRSVAGTVSLSAPLP